MKKVVLGINGLGRVGKLLLWNQIAKKEVDSITVNVGREVGESLQDIARYILRDSTYGALSTYLFGAAARKEAVVGIDEDHGLIKIEGLKIFFMRADRNPKDIDWGEARVVVDTTGRFKDPTHQADHPGGSLRGHLGGHVEKVIISAPFAIGDDKEMPADAVTVILGINGDVYDPEVHCIISNASCTTTCLAHMMKPLLKHFESDRLLSFAIDTIHAVTGKQPVLDCVPASGKVDLCKSRSAMNNIHISTTGAAKALGLVLPEISHVKFIAQSMRIPTMTGSLVSLTMNFTPKHFRGDPVELVNRILSRAADTDEGGYLRFDTQDNVSSDIISAPFAAALIEGSRTQVVDFCDLSAKAIRIYGWYDNELGSYVNMLGEQTSAIITSMG